jgi:L-lactate utilization protein LutC
MKFTVTGSKIICSRKDNTVAEEDKYRAVAEFDAHLDTIAPHVETKLTRGEVEELERFLADRKRIQANTMQVNMLEVLPELIEEATEILNSVSRLNKTMYRELNSAVARLSDALENVKPKNTGKKITPVHRMTEPEAMKERLDNIKRDL